MQHIIVPGFALDRTEARTGLFDAFEGFHHPRQRDSALDYQSPAHYERSRQAAARRSTAQLSTTAGSTMDQTIRNATAADALFLAWVTQTAARSHLPLGVWDLAFPGPDGPRLDYLAALAVAEPPAFTHYDGFLIAESEGSPVAALSAYDPATKTTDAFMMAINNALEATGWSREHRALALARMAPMANCMPESLPGTWIIEWVAALPAARGRGVAHALLQAILDRGRSAGYNKTQISYLIGNKPAQAAYERVGFATVDEKRDVEFEAMFHCPGVACMQREL